MQRTTLDDLVRSPPEVLVIGGGIYGAMTARDAGLRGLRTALVEARDFGSGASHNSLKLMHGGIRYIQHLDFSRLRASAREREFWQRAAPGLIDPLEFAIPLTGYAAKGPEAFRAASVLYNLASRDLRSRHYPGAGVVGKAEGQRRLGAFAPHDLRGVGYWRDGQMVDANRVQWAVLRAAAEARARIANYMPALSLIRHGDRIVGARLRDEITGQEADIRADVTIVAAGGGTARLAGAELPEAARKRFPSFARATNIVIDRPATERGIGVVSRSKSDAVVDRGGRLYFLTPWRGKLIVGTHESSEAGRDIATHNPADVDAFLDEIAYACPSLGLTRQDVLYAYQGLIPADVDDSRSGGVKRQTRGTLIDHGEADGVPGLITAVGVKYTTARLIAERAVDHAAAQLGQGRPSQSLETPLPPDRLPEPALGDPATLARQAVATLDDTMAHSLADVVLRRLPLAELGALRGAEGRQLLGTIASAMATALGWDPERQAAEIAAIAKEPALHGAL